MLVENSCCCLVSFVCPRELVSFVHPRELVSFVCPRELVSFVSSGELVSFDPQHVMYSPPNRQRYLTGEVQQQLHVLI